MASIKFVKFIKIVSLNKLIARNASFSTQSKKNNLKSWESIPGPPTLPFLGPLHNFLPGGMFFKMTGSDLFAKLYEKYGPIIKLKGIFGKPDAVFLCDAESCAQVLRGEDWLPDRPGFQCLIYYRKKYKCEKKGTSPFKTGLLSDSGQEWREFRSTVNHIMLQPKRIKIYENVLNEVSIDMVERLKRKRDAQNMISSNFGQEMHLWALESIASVALGTRLNCVYSDLPANSSAMRLIKCVRDIFEICVELEVKPSLWLYYPTKSFKKAMVLFEQQEDLAKEFITNALQKIRTNSTDDNEKGVLEKLLEVNEEVAYTMASDMLFAGVDTTSNTMLATLYLLATNISEQEKLRKEVMEKKETKYLKACIKESLRMLPVVAGNMRVVTKDYQLLGYEIPKNSRVGFAHQTISNMESHFVNAKKFIPERWIVEKSHPLYHGRAHPFAYLPFGFGARSCVGRRIAELELELFLAKIIENFRLEWTGPAPTINSTALNIFIGPYGFKLHDV